MPPNWDASFSLRVADNRATIPQPEYLRNVALTTNTHTVICRAWGANPKTAISIRAEPRSLQMQYERQSACGARIRQQQEGWSVFGTAAALSPRLQKWHTPTLPMRPLVHRRPHYEHLTRANIQASTR
ncbi:hypothetical protein KL929_000913 [Ogataea haglerorum]|nr:hypothetical protein KL929_000913 [Ogataea haglerorum]